MAGDYDPSPRASKRRRTTYGGQRTILQDKSKTSLSETINETLHGKDHDSISAEFSHTEQNAETTEPELTQVEDAEGDDESNTHKDHDSMSSKENEEPLQTRSSRRATRRPRRYSESTEIRHTAHTRTPSKAPSTKEPPKTAPIPKGILTPSKRQRALPQKTVVFDENEKAIGEQLGFRDIQTTPTKQKEKSKGKQKALTKTKKSSEPSVQDEAVSDAASTAVPPADDFNFEDMLVDEPDIVPTFPMPVTLSDANDLPSCADQAELVQIKRQVLSRLASRTLTPPSHLESQYNTVHTLLTSTIIAGESNSLLLLGPRGSGKSLLIETALSDLGRSYSNDFHTVHLNGFFQTDDRLALREIWRQLGREMQVNEDEVDEVSSYADTMASLLSLLAHPDELSIDAAPAKASTDTKKSSKSVVFVLDEFELFTTHPRQTLLYNLFDIAQSRKAPIAVLGCSTRMDVVDCLEKRVKSRYSHRWIHVPFARSLAVFEETVKAVLLVDEQSEHSRDSSVSTQSIKEQQEYSQRWNEFIKTTFLPSSNVQTLIKSHFHTTKSLPNLLVAIYPLIANASLPPSSAKAASNLQSTTSETPSTTLSTISPSFAHLLPSLPTLHLSLLAAAARLETIHSLPTINFNLVHAHYAELIERGRQQQAAQTSLAMTANILSPAVGVAAGSQTVIGNAGGALRLWGQQTCRAAWEELGRWSLVAPAVGGGGGVAGDEGLGGGHEVDSRMFRCDVMLEEVLWGVREKWKDGEGAGVVLGKWCTEI